MAVVKPDILRDGGGAAGLTDVAAIEELYRGCARRMVVAAYGLTGNLAEAQDAVQEAFVRAVAAPQKVLRAENPEAWLRTVALNVARSRFRRRQHLDMLMRRKPPLPETLPGMSADRIALLHAMRQLSVREREAIALHHLADLEVTQVAEILGAPVGTVKSWLKRGRTKLAGLLGDDLGDDDDNA
ncbi:SigE family RNA polymerase sigma factor [Fodinicola feengrottensis]|uniref:SigE family RNA polymerase sigma factor n=1 Tax=Fodinicola feengrottensis TaxID=435914 RepID=A0ABP4S5Y6_9ACTN